MGSFLDKPKTEKDTHSDASDELQLQASVSCMQGWRVDMEDAHTVKLGLDDAKDYAWFAVFDGHGGSLVSQHSSEHVLGKVVGTPEWKADHKSTDNIGRAMKRGFLEMDEELRKLPDVTRGDDHSGSTAIAALVTPTHVIVANCGDSRSILVRKAEAVEMSYDHKPYLENEQRRIEAAGGTVTMRRVNGDLAVSRALGDFVYKHRRDLQAEEQQVSAEPEIKALERHADDEFLVLACDGIWDVMTNQDVADFVSARSHAAAADLTRTAEALLDECLNRGSRDNMSVVLVSFPAGRARVAGAAAAGGAAPPPAVVAGPGASTSA